MPKKSVHNGTLPENIDVCESEHHAQVRVVKFLKRRKVLFCAVPNGGYRHTLSAVKLKREGVVAGVPDLLVFTPAPKDPTARGVAIELKTVRGRLSLLQVAFHVHLRAAGWRVYVCRGSEEALTVLQGLGY